MTVNRLSAFWEFCAVLTSLIAGTLFRRLHRAEKRAQAANAEPSTI